MNRLRNLVARMAPRTRAAVMSLLLPGLGQMYLGRGGRAVIWFAGLVVVYLIAGSDGADSAASAKVPICGRLLNL